jgi:hypothetical protein
MIYCIALSVVCLSPLLLDSSLAGRLIGGVKRSSCVGAAVRSLDVTMLTVGNVADRACEGLIHKSITTRDTIQLSLVYESICLDQS